MSERTLPPTEEQDPTCTIGRCKCGGIVFAGVEGAEHRKANAREVAKLVRAGFNVETGRPLDTARSGSWCTQSKEHMRD